MAVLVYTMGDPNGLGPELLFLADVNRMTQKHVILIIGLEKALTYHHHKLGGRQVSWSRISRPEQDLRTGPGIYLYQPAGLESIVLRPGQKDIQGGFAAGAALKAACDFLKSNPDAALVTGPLNKSLLIQAGFDFPGHTEFLAHELGVDKDRVCMHLCGERLRVSLVTTHHPLRRVPEMISKEKILSCLRLTSAFTIRLGLGKKPIGVCGLNPHAGEQGRIGREELDIIAPAVDQAGKEGLNVMGPYPADTIFYRAFQGEFSAVLAMYHDQGLGPLKLVEFGQCVNITLGLPVVRTSVDHGTGYDLVGTGRAGSGSLSKAFALAVRLAAEKNAH